MELTEFLQQTQADVQSAISNGLAASDAPYPYPEAIFAEIVMQHMNDIGMTFEPQVCHYLGKVGNAPLRITGFGISEDADQLDLFVSLYDGSTTLESVSDTDTKAAAEQCLRFLARCVEGRLASTMDQSHDAYSLALTIQHSYANLEQIRIYVLTDRQARSKNFTAREIGGKTVKLEVMDIERLHRHWSEGKPRDELVVNFEEVSGAALPCVYIPATATGYDYALTAIPGDALRYVYEKFGDRLLEANVRAFLSATGKVNRGIRDTLRDDPEKFMAYNNGIVVVADETGLGTSGDGGTGLVWLKGLQVVNGGQTTASIYFTKKRSPETDLSQVRVAAKIIILRSRDGAAEEGLISDISRYANSQNSVRQSDLSSNNPYHVELEKIAATTYCPDGVGRWFYERAGGAYNTMLARQGTTPALLKKMKEQVVPTSRKITKTDLAKYLNAWNERPDAVSLGSQKNFERFITDIKEAADGGTLQMPDVAEYKRMIATAILFRRASSLVRPMFPAFQANITSYLVAIIANRLRSRLDLERIWQKQDLSPQLKQQLQVWAHEVSGALKKAAAGRMISEAAKKVECWEAVREAKYSPVIEGIPEIRL